MFQSIFLLQLLSKLKRTTIPKQSETRPFTLSENGDFCARTDRCGYFVVTCSMPQYNNSANQTLLCNQSADLLRQVKCKSEAIKNNEIQWTGDDGDDGDDNLSSLITVSHIMINIYCVVNFDYYCPVCMYALCITLCARWWTQSIEDICYHDQTHKINKAA